MPVTLWGEHATSFEDDFLIETIGNDEPVVVIFAGQEEPAIDAFQLISSDSVARSERNIVCNFGDCVTI